jgi:large subunit ribosomal protein L21
VGFSTQATPVKAKHLARRAGTNGIDKNEKIYYPLSTNIWPRGDEGMYAVVRTGGKQYTVREGDLIQTERIDGAVGDLVELKEVLLVEGEKTFKVGTPAVSKARVIGKIVEQGKARKIVVFKMKRRKNVRRKRGHRQLYTKLMISQIKA